MSSGLFLSLVDKLTEKNMAVNELIEAAARLKASDEADGVAQLYKLWLRFNQNHPLLYAVYFNYGVVLTAAGDLQGAKEALERTVALNPDFYPAYINLGGVLERLGSASGAVTQWLIMVGRLQAVTGNAINFKAMALKQVARVLETNQQTANAEYVLQQCLDTDPHQADAIQHFVALRLGHCEWPVVTPWERMDRKALMKGISPLSMAIYTDDPMLQLAGSWNYCKNFLGYPATDFRGNRQIARTDARRGRRRIGYVSSDLRNHAVGHVMAELFELHDRKEFEIFAYYCGPAAETDPLQIRIKAAVEHWVDIDGFSDDAAAHRIMEDGIEILVDVNGYTKGARTNLFAMRPAPILANWLGYPGSMASPYHNYIIADEWIIPEDHEKYYSEKVVRLPCYQPNDRKRVTAPERPSRKDAGLPEEGTVFCCFNGMQKISRFTFERWMTILERVPDSVLWLFSETGTTNKRLVDHAVKCGIAPERLIFASRQSNPSHLARLPLADLFLDTSPYGAHVTASDALWAGVPILTVSGRGFASRVCGSLVRSAGIPELVCESPREYVERAVALGSDRAQLQRLKEKLLANRNTCTLFDSLKLTHHLEALYAMMWNDFCQGRMPRPDLSNLDVYLDIGSDEDHETVEFLAIKDYETWYKTRMARRHRYCPIGADKRLWTAADIAEEDRNSEWPFYSSESDEKAIEVKTKPLVANNN